VAQVGVGEQRRRQAREVAEGSSGGEGGWERGAAARITQGGRLAGTSWKASSRGTAPKKRGTEWQWAREAHT